MELGGSAKTEVSGFSPYSLEVILKNEHSLTLRGSSEKLIASTTGNTELLATDWTAKTALVSLSDDSKMELNVSDLLKGNRVESADLTYPSNKNLKVQVNMSKNK
jgi:hypothetical protein